MTFALAEDAVALCEGVGFVVSGVRETLTCRVSDIGPSSARSSESPASVATGPLSFISRFVA